MRKPGYKCYTEDGVPLVEKDGKWIEVREVPEERKEMGKLAKQAKGLTKALDKVFDNSPNVYKFLVDKGIDEDIAEDAQELVTDMWLEATKVLEIIAEEKLENCCAEIEALSDKVRGFSEKLSETFEQ